MSPGAWLDVFLLAVLVLALAGLYRLRRARSRLAQEPTVKANEPEGEGRLSRRLGRYYPSLARQAGLDPNASRGFYWLAKLFLGAFLPLLLLETLRLASIGTVMAWLVVLGLLGFHLPDAFLLVRRHRRRQQITRSLAYFLDLLVAFLHSGLSLQQAFRRAARDGLDPSQPLAQEAALVALELDAGREPAAAFQALAERTGVADLVEVASSLRGGMRLGAPIAGTLEAQAEMQWTKRRETALRRINAAVVKALFPVMLCGFPVFVMLVFFPAVVELLEALRDLAGFFR